MAVNNAVNEVPSITGVSNQILVTQTAGSSTATIGTASTQLSTTQPMFEAYLSSTASNVTGDGTTYPVVFDTATVNQGSSYSTGTGQFTVPVTGNYLFESNILFSVAALSGVNQLVVNLLVGTDRYSFDLKFFPAGLSASQLVTLGGSIIIPLIATNVVFVRVNALAGSKVVSLTGSASEQDTYFGGYLLH